MKNSFFSFVTIPIRIFIFAIVILYFFSCGMSDKEQEKQNRIKTEGLTQFDIQRSLVAAMDYFKCNYESINNPDALVILEELEELYELDFKLESKLSNSKYDQFNLILKRLYDKEYMIEKNAYQSYIKKTEGFNKYSVMSLYCDEYPLPKDYLKILEEKIILGGYETTHAGFQLQLAINNDCFREEDEAIVDIKKIFNDKLKQVVGEEGVVTDKAIEAQVVLNYLGLGKSKKKDWLKQVVDTQQKDGGWLANLGDTESHPHTAGLAFWLLLEEIVNPSVELDSNEESEYQKMIENYSSKNMNEVLYSVLYFLGENYSIEWNTIPFFQSIYAEYKGGFTDFYRMYIGTLSSCEKKSYSEIDSFSNIHPVFNKSLYSLSGLYCKNIEKWLEIIPEESIINTMQQDQVSDLVLMTKWANENGCMKEKTYKELRKILIPKLVGNVEIYLEDSEESGVGFEGIAMLYYLDAKEEVRQEWIDYVISQLDYYVANQNEELTDHRAIVYGYWIYLTNRYNKNQINWSKQN